MQRCHKQMATDELGNADLIDVECKAFYHFERLWKRSMTSTINELKEERKEIKIHSRTNNEGM